MRARERERAGPPSCGDVAAVRDATAQKEGLEEDVVVAAVADAETVAASETAACLDELDAGKQGSKGETPEGC